MLVPKVTCQACGETDHQVNDDSNHDTSTKFFVFRVAASMLQPQIQVI